MSDTPRTNRARADYVVWKDKQCDSDMGGGRELVKPVAPDGWATARDLERESDRLAAENAELQAWKESAMQVESEWDEQAVGHLLGMRLGSSIRAGIQPAIEKLLRDRAMLREALEEAEDALSLLVLIDKSDLAHNTLDKAREALAATNDES